MTRCVSKYAAGIVISLAIGGLSLAVLAANGKPTTAKADAAKAEPARKDDAKAAVRREEFSLRWRLEQTARAEAVRGLLRQIENWPFAGEARSPLTTQEGESRPATAASGPTVKDFLDRKIPKGELFEDFPDQSEPRARIDMRAFLRTAERTAPLRFFSSGECDIDVMVPAAKVVAELQRLAAMYGGSEFPPSKFKTLADEKKIESEKLYATASGRPPNIESLKEQLYSARRRAGGAGALGGRGGFGGFGGAAKMGGFEDRMGMGGGPPMGGGGLKMDIIGDRQFDAQMPMDFGRPGRGMRGANMRQGPDRQKERVLKTIQSTGWENVTKDGAIRAEKWASQTARRVLWSQVLGLRLNDTKRVADFVESYPTITESFREEIERKARQKDDDSGPYADQIYTVVLVLTVDELRAALQAALGSLGGAQGFTAADFQAIARNNASVVEEDRILVAGHATPPRAEIKKSEDEETKPIDPPDWASKTIRATGNAILPAGELDQAVQYQLARTEALCALMDQVDDLPLPTGQTVAQFLIANSDAKFDLATHLTSALVLNRSISGSRATMVLELTLDRVWRIVRYYEEEKKAKKDKDRDFDEMDRLGMRG